MNSRGGGATRDSGEDSIGEDMKRCAWKQPIFGNGKRKQREVDGWPPPDSPRLSSSETDQLERLSRT
jgi:hypothetical protein